MTTLPTHLRSPSLAKGSVTRDVRAGHQRERVLVCATEVFAKRGYQGASVDSLLAAAGVGVNNFYSLFEGKEDCFIAVLDRAERAAREAVAGAIAGSPTWEESAYRGLAASFGFLDDRPSEAWVLVLEAQSAGATAMARYNAILDAAVDWLRKGRESNPEAADLPNGFEQAAVSGLAFYLQQCLVGSIRRTPHELVSEAAILLLEPFMGARKLRQLERNSRLHLSTAR
ncbi:MAG TPA: TetR/AcrR family transcriptional regulator [Solirubrobacterales bacterium]|jgi:AcrR family transcriptional regulator